MRPVPSALDTDYCIKEGYRARSESMTAEGSFGDYWTADRIANSKRYQWHVYAMAAAWAAKRNFRSLLDIGCGYPSKHHVFKAFRVTLVDQPTVVEALQSKFPQYEWVADDLERADSLQGRRFDLVLCSDVIEHLMDPDPLVRMMRRLTGGLAIISTPQRDIVRGTDCMSSPKPEHVREWNAAEFRAYLESRGMKVVRQIFFPPKRISAPEFVLSRTLKLRSKRWSACQVAVCQAQDGARDA